MAPSLRGAGTRTRKAQPTVLGYAKVTKASTVTTGRKGVKLTIENVDTLLNPAGETSEPTTTPPIGDKKRKRGIYASEAEESETEEIPVGKKLKVFLPSPPSSERSGRSSPREVDDKCICSRRYDRSPSPPPMPQGLKDLLEMHQHLIRAFSFHRAHNGPSAPAELNELLQSITRLYKKRSISKEDIQRMLAMYEVEEKTCIPAQASLVFSQSPFKLLTSGVGANRRNFVDYVGTDLMGDIQEWDEELLQSGYKFWIDYAYVTGRRDKLSFIQGPVADYPLLAFVIGSQTAARQQKASDLRNHVLGKPAVREGSPELSGLTLTDPNSPPQATKAIKARTASLFERVKAKQATNMAAPAPTSEAVLRRHAIARMDEVIEVLKMKQRQKLNFTIEPATYTSCETPLRRVSFTFTELIKIVKGSMTNPMSNDELKTCINILAREAPGFWIRRLDMDGVLCVVLQGNGPAGQDVQKVFKAKESRAADAEFCDYEETD